MFNVHNIKCNFYVLKLSISFIFKNVKIYKHKNSKLISTLLFTTLTYKLWAYNRQCMRLQFQILKLIYNIIYDHLNAISDNILLKLTYILLNRYKIQSIIIIFFFRYK